jgi:hypothetical protein
MKLLDCLKKPVRARCGVLLTENLQQSLCAPAYDHARAFVVALSVSERKGKIGDIAFYHLRKHEQF